MKFTKCDYSKIDKPIRTNLTKLLLDFQKCEIKCAKVEDWEYCSPQCGASTINRRAKSLKLFHIKAIVRDEEIYIINNLID